MTSPTLMRRVAPLVFGSGFCGLIYQTAWMREFRLVFGASTAASAAVLAIFIGGLGIGGLLLGKRVDASPRPLSFYGNLELLIAASAAVSPLLLRAVRAIYIATGGTFALGIVLGTLIRLALAAVVLALPTLAMGGTLAAVSRAAEDPGDDRRRGLAILYGVNTLGAVAGAMASTFVLLQVLGTRKTIWVATLVNGLIALIARSIGKRLGDRPASPAAGAAASPDARAPLWFVLGASGVVGFAFFLMEMTWYRMLGPILGGTVFTFGLILSLALFGLGVGGLGYALRPASKAATIRGLFLTCVIEAIVLAIPLAAGDRVALGAAVLRTTVVFGFVGQVAGWAVIAGFVVVPAAIASGVQFPLLVNLVGRGGQRIGAHLGLVYATNTVGAIAGALLGGFILLPGMGAVGCWRLAVGLLVALAATALVLVAKTSTKRQLAASGAAIAIACTLLFAHGPTAAWRHAGIGAGRTVVSTPDVAVELIHYVNRSLLWESEGVESSVALLHDNGLSFVVNGKIDGNVLVDACTQMMGGLVGAIIHPSPRRVLVIGLGTGETAGWLADAPGVERVDVIELEPSIAEVALRSAQMNRDVLHNPKVHVYFGDAREALLVGDERYDIIFSEPSNPYRAGVASLFTREFYEAVLARLNEAGLFLQWAQSYEVDGKTISTIYATLGTAFSEIHTFRLCTSDLLFVASRSPIEYDSARIAARTSGGAVHDALAFSWGVEGVEGFLSHFLGDTRLAAAIAATAGADINTDDATLIEFEFARSLGATGLQNLGPIRQIAPALHADYPQVKGAFDMARFDELRAFADSLANLPAVRTDHLDAEHVARISARESYAHGNLVPASASWKLQSRVPASHHDAMLVAESFAATGEQGDTSVLRPAEASFVRARYLASHADWPGAAAELQRGFIALRVDPFLDLDVIQRAIHLAVKVADQAPATAKNLVGALGKPFAMYARDEDRLLAELTIAAGTDAATIASILTPLEPYVPWRHEILVMRRAAYAATRDARLDEAEDDLDAFERSYPQPIDTNGAATSAGDPSSPSSASRPDRP